MRIIDVLPKIVQWESIPYANDLCCQDCGTTGFRGIGSIYPKLVGWCETNYGFQAVFECPYCGSKFRFHGGDPCDDIDDFDLKLGLHFAKRCENWKEIRQKLGES